MINELTFFAEIMYTVSNYEKSTIPNIKCYSLKHIKRLNCSIKTLLCITQYLSSKSFQREEVYYNVRKYLEQYGTILFEQQTLSKYYKYLSNNNLPIPNISNIQHTLILHIQKILLLLNSYHPIIISHRSKCFFTKYLYALHNLPRGLLNNPSCTLSNTQPLSPQQALEYAQKIISNYK